LFVKKEHNKNKATCSLIFIRSLFISLIYIKSIKLYSF